MKSQPVVILGAARSGTNILRDSLASLPGVGTWPCDEINYIWRHGNAGHPTDEFSREMATPGVVRYIRQAFDRESRRQRIEHVVEKTCANTLRVGFVDEILPDAKYVYIVRNGLDVVASARERWVAPLDLAYTLRKIRYAPMSDIPRYALLQLKNRAVRLISREKRLSYWGPRFEGLETALREKSIEEVSALQWLRCVEAAESALEEIEQDRVIRLTYEAFARSPKEELRRIAEFIGADWSDRRMDELTESVSSRSIGRGKRLLGAMELERVLEVIGPALEARGYHPRD